MKKKDDLIREFLDGAPIQFFIDQAIAKTTECFLNCGPTKAKSEVIRLLTEARVVGMEMEKTHKENKNGR